MVVDHTKQFFIKKKLEANPANAKDMFVTPSVLHHKSFTKTRHEHHTYGVMHVMKRIGEAFQLKRSIRMQNEKLLHDSYNYQVWL